MVSKRSVILAGVFGLVLVGVAAFSYACATCGCSAGAKAAKVAVTKPFDVLDVTGPAKGEKLCYICRYGGGPSFVVFTRRADGHIRHLAPEIQKAVTANAKHGVRAFVVLLADNTEANRAKLTALAKELHLTIPLTIAGDGAKGPASYELPAKFDTRVLVANRNKVLSTIEVNCAKDACGSTQCARVSDVAAASKTLVDSL